MMRYRDPERVLRLEAIAAACIITLGAVMAPAIVACWAHAAAQHVRFQ